MIDHESGKPLLTGHLPAAEPAPPRQAKLDHDRPARETARHAHRQSALPQLAQGRSAMSSGPMERVLTAGTRPVTSAGAPAKSSSVPPPVTAGRILENLRPDCQEPRSRHRRQNASQCR